jgi:hypothetical protein
MRMAGEFSVGSREQGTVRVEFEATVRIVSFALRGES